MIITKYHEINGWIGKGGTSYTVHDSFPQLAYTGPRVVSSSSAAVAVTPILPLKSLVSVKINDVSTGEITLTIILPEPVTAELGLWFEAKISVRLEVTDGVLYMDGIVLTDDNYTLTWPTGDPRATLALHKSLYRVDFTLNIPLKYTLKGDHTGFATLVGTTHSANILDGTLFLPSGTAKTAETTLSGTTKIKKFFNIITNGGGPIQMVGAAHDNSKTPHIFGTFSERIIAECFDYSTTTGKLTGDGYIQPIFDLTNNTWDIQFIDDGTFDPNEVTCTVTVTVVGN